MPISKKNKLPRRIIFIKEGVIGFTLGAFVVLGVFVYALYTLAAWSNPTQPPTGGNVDAPVNIGLSSQDKLGTFKIGTSTNAANLFVYNGNIGISTTTAGYGLTLDKGDSVSSIFVANGRVVGLKWIPVTNDEAASKYYVDQAVLGLNYWSINGSNNIYNNNSGGMVGIGTNNPTYQLDVAGQGRFISPNNAPVNSYRQTTPDGLLWSTLRLERTLTSGTAQNGSGAAIFFRTQNDSGASTIAGFLGGGLSTVTTGSEIGFLGFKASFNGHDPGTLNNFGLKLTAVSDTADTAVFSGNVGIGTTGPESSLHIEKSVSGGLGADLVIANKSGSVTNNAVAIDFGVDNSTVANGAGNAQIKVLNMNGANNISDMTFSTWNGAAFGERMRITGAGNLGIGSSTPINKLTVEAAGPAITIKDTTTKQRWDLYNSANTLQITNGFTTMMTIANGGSVGIGTTGPGAKLDVRGGNVLVGADPGGFGYALGTSAAGTLRWVTRMVNTEGGSNSGSDLTFVSRDDSGAMIKDALVIQRSSGNVGIGTIQPGSLLEVANGSSDINLVKNGGFNLGINGSWSMYVNGAAGASASITTDATTYMFAPQSAKITVTGGGGGGPDVQVYGGISDANGVLVQNRYYTFSFWGKASASVSNSAGLILNGSPWTQYTLPTIAYTTNWKKYTVGFTYSGATTNNVRVEFYFGGTNNVTYWIDGITLVAGAVSPEYSSLTVRDNGDTTIYGDAFIAGLLTVGNGDVAEEFYTDQDYPAGTVLVMGDQGYKSARASTIAYDNRVIGVVSEKPGVVVGKIDGQNKAPVALTGVVKVRVNDSGGKIRAGDQLTTSAVAGEAMLAAKVIPGTIIGKALEADTGKGWVMAIVNLK